MKTQKWIFHNGKKKIYFCAPLHISQGVKIKNGIEKKYLAWTLPERFVRFLISLLPRIEEKEIGAQYKTIREGYFWIGYNGQLERKELRTIDEETEELIINTCVSIEINEINDSNPPEKALGYNVQLER